MVFFNYGCECVHGVSHLRRLILHTLWVLCADHRKCVDRSSMFTHTMRNKSTNIGKHTQLVIPIMLCHKGITLQLCSAQIHASNTSLSS